MGLDVAKLLGRHSVAQYRDALLALLPQGKLWQDEKQDSNGQIYRLCEVWAQEYAKLEDILYSLHAQTSPLTAKEIQPWALATGISLLESRQLAQRIKILVTLIGSQASTQEGITGIAKTLGYTLKLERNNNTKAQQRIKLHSASMGFKALSSEIATEKVANLGRVRCKEKLWPNQSAIHTTIAEMPKHQNIRAEVKLLEDLLPAQWNIDTRYESL